MRCVILCSTLISFFFLMELWDNMLQHEAIANYYRNLISNTLMLAFPGLSSTDASAIAWEELCSTTV